MTKIEEILGYPESPYSDQLTVLYPQVKKAMQTAAIGFSEWKDANYDFNGNGYFPINSPENAIVRSLYELFEIWNNK